MTRRNDSNEPRVEISQGFDIDGDGIPDIFVTHELSGKEAQAAGAGIVVVVFLGVLVFIGWCAVVWLMENWAIAVIGVASVGLVGALLVLVRGLANTTTKNHGKQGNEVRAARPEGKAEDGPILFRCRHCGKEFYVLAHWEGTPFDCSCGNEIVVPKR